MFFNQISRVIGKGSRGFSTSQLTNAYARTTFVGRIAQDPEVRQSKTGDDEFIRYVVAVEGQAAKNANGAYDKAPVEYYNIFAFGNAAKNGIFSYLRKGCIVEAQTKLVMKDSGAKNASDYPIKEAMFHHERIEVIQWSPKPTGEDQESNHLEQI